MTGNSVITYHGLTYCPKGERVMTEANDQPAQQEVEGQVESKIASKFQAAREETMKESRSLSEIYRSITKPGFKDVYASWVRNMDTVANSYSWGKDKPAFRTRLLKVLNRIVGATMAGITVPIDLVIDFLTWPARKLPIAKQTIGHFIPTHTFSQAAVRGAERAKTSAFIWRGVGQVARIGELPFAVVGGITKKVAFGTPIAEGRAVTQFVGQKINEVTARILHPKSKV